jgi:hypothetical protein
VSSWSFQTCTTTCLQVLACLPPGLLERWEGEDHNGQRPTAFEEASLRGQRLRDLGEICNGSRPNERVKPLSPTCHHDTCPVPSYSLSLPGPSLHPHLNLNPSSHWGATTSILRGQPPVIVRLVSLRTRVPRRRDSCPHRSLPAPRC